MALSALVLMRPEARGQTSAPPISVSTMNHVTLTVSDVPRSVAFYQRIFGMPLVTTQGTEADWSAPTVPVLGIGNGPQFIAFSRGDRPSINHYCLGMEGFDADRVVKMLARYLWGVVASLRHADGQFDFERVEGNLWTPVTLDLHLDLRVFFRNIRRNIRQEWLEIRPLSAD